MDLPIYDENEWQIFEFSVEPEDRDSFILKTIKPVIAALDQDGSLNWFHFMRSKGGVDLRINADKDVSEVIEQNTDIKPNRVKSQNWYEHDKVAGEYGARFLISERERLSRRTIKVLEAESTGNDIDILQFMARQAHLSTNSHGAYLNFNGLIHYEDDLGELFSLFKERRP